jgi:hypothetical protein
MNLKRLFIFFNKKKTSIYDVLTASRFFFGKAHFSLKIEFEMAFLLKTRIFTIIF